MSAQIGFVIATLNSEATIDRCLRSILVEQDLIPDVVIIDGGSSDATMTIVSNYAQWISIIVSEPDTGIYDAWNKGVRLLDSDWIGFIGADDYLHSDACTNLANAIAEQKNINYLSANLDIISSDGHVINTVGRCFEWVRFRRAMEVAHVGSLHRRSLFETYGLFDDSYHICGDYEFLLRIGTKIKPGYVNHTIGEMTAGGISYLSIKSLVESRRAKLSTCAASEWEATCDFFVVALKVITYRLLNRILSLRR